MRFERRIGAFFYAASLCRAAHSVKICSITHERDAPTARACASTTARVFAGMRAVACGATPSPHLKDRLRSGFSCNPISFSTLIDRPFPMSTLNMDPYLIKVKVFSAPTQKGRRSAPLIALMSPASASICLRANRRRRPPPDRSQGQRVVPAGGGLKRGDALVLFIRFRRQCRRYAGVIRW